MGGFFAVRKAQGPRLTTSADPSQYINLFSRPAGGYVVAQGRQGESCVIVESILLGGGARWYHVKVMGGDGWTQLVDDG